ncbi:MAG TPA: glutathione-disulfide reductase [Beijerinckiaceae bacterium]|jgi:glutathione reductase (NADPH)|nr:glutathione-disulfide reductase [Beijerinckiaceae bacterium]
MTDAEVDLFVIGAGSGGTRAARIAASYGAKVMVAEEFRVGGTCVIRGCIPKKLFVYASRFRDEFEDAEGFGWKIEKTSFDWPTLVAGKEKEITRLSGIYGVHMTRAGAEIVESRAVIEDAHTVRLLKDGRCIRAKYILIATGGGPVLEPKIPGLEHTITSNEIFDLPVFPQRLLIVGGGYIAVEFASVFTRLGASVTQVLRGENVLRGFDDDLRTNLAVALRGADVDLRTGILPTRIEKTNKGLDVHLSDGSCIEADQVLIATGRRPNTKDLGLEKVGVELNKKGAVVVDSHSKTSVDNIYAVGDVTDRINLTPVAVREGHAFADTIFGGRPTAVNHVNVPSAVFTTPEIGTVGLSEQEARNIFDCVDIYLAHFRPLKATLSGREEKVLMKIIVDGTTDQVLGIHVLGHDAGEMAQLVAIPVRMGCKKADFDATMALHPTAAEELVTMRTRAARYERTAAERA